MSVSQRLPRNLLWLYGADALAKVVAMGAFAWIARALGDDGVGHLEFALQVLFVLTLVQDAGLDQFGAREAAKDPSRTAGLAGSIFVLRIGLVILALCGLSALVWALDRPSDAELAVLLVGAVLIPAPLVFNWVFQSRDEMNVHALSSVTRQLVFAGGVLLLVRERSDLWRVPLCDAAGLTIVAVGHQFLFRARVGAIQFAGAVARARGVFREALPLAVSSFAWALRITAPLIALYLFLTDAGQTGQFGVGHRLVIALHTLVWLYFVNLLPSLSRTSLETDRTNYRRLMSSSVRIVGWVAPTVCIVLTALAPWLVPALFSAEFAQGADAFRIQVWMLAAAFVSGHARFALIAFGRQTQELQANAVGLTIAAGGCIALGVTGRLNPLSAAFTFVAAELATAYAADRLCARRIEPMSLPRLLWRPALSTAVAGAVVITLESRGFSPFVTAPAALAIAGVAALVLDRQLIADGRRLIGSVMQR